MDFQLDQKAKNLAEHSASEWVRFMVAGNRDKQIKSSNSTEKNGEI